MKQFLIGSFLSLMTLGGLASGQALPTANSFSRQQVTIAVGGSFTRKVTDNGIVFDPTSALDGSVGYRFNLTRWLGVEGDYDFFRNRQKYISSTSVAQLPTDVHVATGAIVLNIPNSLTKRFTSFFSAGGSELLFYPRDTDAFDRQLKNAVMIGGGVDMPISRHIAIRLQDRTFLYKEPSLVSNCSNEIANCSTASPGYSV